jgi:hypothetical protein
LNFPPTGSSVLCPRPLVGVERVLAGGAQQVERFLVVAYSAALGRSVDLPPLSGRQFVPSVNRDEANPKDRRDEP